MTTFYATPLSVGALARAGGLTVRTLHHWDAIGLLVPCERTQAGYRRYGAAEVARLYRILALRRLGLSLEEVAAALDREGPALAGAVRAHLARVDEQLEAAAALRDRLVRILDVLDASGEPSVDSLIDAIEVMTMHDSYYTPEQLAQLEQRREALGDEGMQRAQQDWADLIAEVAAARAAGTDPAAPEVQALAARWRALLEQFTGGDPGIAASLKRMYATEGVEKASRGVMSPDLMAYMGRAMDAGAA
jgi:DNA-binding transcriptional MerR regulator